MNRRREHGAWRQRHRGDGGRAPLSQHGKTKMGKATVLAALTAAMSVLRCETTMKTPRRRAGVAFVVAALALPAVAADCPGFAPQGESTRAKVSHMDAVVASLTTELGERLHESKPNGASESADKLRDAERCRDSLIKRRNFEGWSSFVGRAVLRKRGHDGDNDMVDIAGAQLLLWNPLEDDTTGAGIFVGFNLPTNDTDAMDYVGAGVAVSGRFPDSAHQFNLGFGYMIDRRQLQSAATTDGPPELPATIDRSGPFISLSFNALSSGFPVFRTLTSAVSDGDH